MNSWPFVVRVPRGRALVAVLAAAAVVGLLGVMVHHSSATSGWEQGVTSFIRHLGIRNRMAEGVMVFWREGPFTVLTLALAAAGFVLGRRRVAILGAVGSVVAVGLTEYVLKPLVDRPSLFDGGSMFPSGHTTAAAAWATFAWFVIGSGQTRNLLALVPLGVGVAVVAARVHHPADALAGWIVGTLTVALVVTMIQVPPRDDTEQNVTASRATPQ